MHIPLCLEILQIQHKAAGSLSTSQLALESLPSEEDQPFNFPSFLGMQSLFTIGVFLIFQKDMKNEVWVHSSSKGYL